METTDPQDELFDIVDEYGEPLGYSKPRGEVHRDGDWHRSFHLWIWGIEDGVPFILFQRRSPTKDIFPNKLDVSVGGHIRAGETLEETVREAHEELGVDLQFDDLTRLGTCFDTSAGPVFTDREVLAVFSYRCDQPLEEYRLHPEEISGLVRIPLAEARALFNGEVDGAISVEWDGASTPATAPVSEADFAGNAAYGRAALDAIAARLRGEPPEPFEIRTQSPQA